MRVNNIFVSYQGEGFFTGTKAVFIRLSGCNLNCSFCDTEHTQYTDMTEEEILEQVKKYDVDLIVITGGEPLLQDLRKIIRKLWEKNYIINIETNGTIIPEEYMYRMCYITCSPKPGWKIKKCDELKIVLADENLDLKQFDAIKASRFTINPVDINGNMNFDKVIKKAEENKKWKIGIQLHKIYKIN